MHEITCWRFSRAVADIVTLLIPYFINFRGDELLRDKFTYCSPLNSYVNILVLRDKQSLRKKRNEGKRRKRRMEKWGRGGIRIGGNHSVGWNGSKKGGRTRLPAQEIAGEMMKSRGNSTKRIEEEKKLHRLVVNVFPS